MESELFGHKKGSFTGATQDKQGLILSAHGGSLFLDEIAELPLSMQVKLCVPCRRKIRPVGSDQEIDVDFRVISASHQDLELLVQQARFRQDLFSASMSWILFCLRYVNAAKISCYWQITSFKKLVKSGSSCKINFFESRTVFTTTVFPRKCA